MAGRRGSFRLFAMAPTITVFGKIISSYGLMAVLGFLAGLLFVIMEGKQKRKKREDSIYVYTLGMVGALIGAKGLYLLLNLPGIISDLSLLSRNPALFVSRYISGGMIFYGGLFGAILAAYLCAKSYGDKLKNYYDAVLPAMALFAAFGRLGCFLTGCCYGVETHTAFGIMLNRSQIAPHGVKLVPVQLIECAFDLLLFVLMIVLTKRQMRAEEKDSTRLDPLCVYLVLYAVFRFVLEFFRGDAARGGLWVFSTSQWISLGVLIVCGVFHLKRIPIAI